MLLEVEIGSLPGRPGFMRLFMQQSLARPETKRPNQKRHSAFHIGLTAYRWVPFWHRCQTQVQTLMRLDRNKIEYHLRGLRAIETVLNAL